MNTRSFRLIFSILIAVILFLFGLVTYLWSRMQSQELLIRNQELKLIDYALGISPSSVDSPSVVIPKPKSVLKQTNSFLELGSITGTDKVLHHGYERYYPMFLEGLRDSPIYMLEIGFLLGQSFEMWKLYFPKGNVFFMDKDCAKSYSEARFCGDQGEVEDLSRLLEVKGLKSKLDFIIDDGSHLPLHQITSFKYLFENALKPGGVYIIEDIELSYWQKGETYGYATRYGKDHPDSLITQMKSLADVVNREFAKVSNSYKSKFGEYVDTWVSSVFFGQNCAIVTKMTEKEQKLFGTREYRYKDVVFL